MAKGAQTALVIGGGLAGMEAAIKIGQAGYQVVLVEQETELGGHVRQLYRSFPHWEDPADLLQLKLAALKKNSAVTILTNSRVISAERQSRGFTVVVQDDVGNNRRVEVGAVVLATGFDLFDVACYGEYGYKIYDHVLTALEFETQLRKWAATNTGHISQPPKGVAFFACVGSRDNSKGYPYCSRICCMYLAKQAGLVKRLFPSTKCYVFYMDCRAAGKHYEEFVRSVIEERHVCYVRGRPSKVLPSNGRLLVRAEDTLVGVPVEVTVDVVVLAAAMVPRQESTAVAGMFGAATDAYGFIDGTAASSLQSGARVFYAGACGFPVTMPEACRQGAAAAAEVIALFSQGEEE